MVVYVQRKRETWEITASKMKPYAEPEGSEPSTVAGM